ncbi:hypothetical protein BCR42DRAFT_408199 [Absidia repens]|uniref:Uncharacterized protein n=1 Tax=Absidia repens TaxID=90262 RepID=A0A1X2IPK8_9FUNG|nr:hypothetical protein BCR42DRAFT_408199 [Absidia repens]
MDNWDINEVVDLFNCPYTSKQSSSSFLNVHVSLTTTVVALIINAIYFVTPHSDF